MQHFLANKTMKRSDLEFDKCNEIITELLGTMSSSSSSSSSSYEEDNRQQSSSTSSLNPDVYRHHTAAHNYFTILQLPSPFSSTSSPISPIGSTGSSTIDDLIKQNYLKLVKMHHPDMTKHQYNNNHEDGARKFVEIQEAYSVLKDSYTRSIYEAEVKSFIQLRNNPHYNPSVYSSSIHPSSMNQGGFGSMFNGMRGYDSSSTSAREAGRGSRGFQFGSGGGFGMFRKGVTSSMLLLLPIFGVGFVLLSIVNSNTSSTSNSSNKSGNFASKHQLVEAWFNPQSKQWETPAPWNPLYREYIQHTPTSKMPRAKVVDSASNR